MINHWYLRGTMTYIGFHILEPYESFVLLRQVNVSNLPFAHQPHCNSLSQLGQVQCTMGDREMEDKYWKPYSKGLCCVLSHLSHILSFVTPWTVAHQASLSMGLFRQEYWRGLPCPPPGYVPNPGLQSTSLALAGGFLTSSATWKTQIKTVDPNSWVFEG